MSREKAASILRAAGMPLVYDRWPDGATPSYPCVRYIEGRRGDMCADDGHYLNVHQWEAYLVTEGKDGEAETALETALEESGAPWARLADAPVASEKLYQVEYDFQTI